MQFDILTIFPEFFASTLQTSLLGKALQDRKITIALHNIRDFCTDKHKQVDDLPYGGGPGMVMKPEPIIAAVEALPRKKKSLAVLLTPRGRLFSQEMAGQWARLDQLILICGRYEGVDERVSKLAAVEEVSIGDYVLSGGEAAALIILDTLVRLVPGVLGNQASLAQESFSQGLLEYPQYTRPAEFRGLKVPDILLGGNHAEIEKWRREQALERTNRFRPDLTKGLQKIKK
ncbi:MAG: tRNA (guanosine(37)-N1)-methyltransferase TrmD [Deltaproteobacteria bacterium]|nr:tRNA (guanosine(37)-N1)-methyltransferase TrmD [Deltaproteobacteria bacterium]